MITIEQAQGYYGGQDAAHDFEHVLRVLRLAERIGAAEGANMPVLRAAALLHDIARAEEETSGESHAEAGARQARAILASQEQDVVDQIAEAIRTHRFRASDMPRTLEAQILYDADKLDAIGAIGVARAYAVAGHTGQRLWAEVDPRHAQRRTQEARAEHTPVHEYLYKLARIRGRLFTPEARRIAQERHDYMAGFFERLRAEVDGEL